MRKRFSIGHVRIFLAMWVLFAALTFLIVSQGLDNASQRPLLVAATTVCSILGPMTGAISRDFQGCCFDFSLTLLPYCLSALGFATGTQLVMPPTNFSLRFIRLFVWAAGLIVWFGGGIVSFGHALS